MSGNPKGKTMRPLGTILRTPGLYGSVRRAQEGSSGTGTTSLSGSFADLGEG